MSSYRDLSKLSVLLGVCSAASAKCVRCAAIHAIGAAWSVRLKQVANHRPIHVADGLAPDKVTPRFFPRDVRDPTPRSPIVDAVAQRQVDVAIAWGPVAAYFAKSRPEELEVVTVGSPIQPPFPPMTFAMTIGVRPGDVALRGRLNITIARSWDEIQAVLKEYDIRLIPLPEPFL